MDLEQLDRDGYWQRELLYQYESNIRSVVYAMNGIRDNLDAWLSRMRKAKTSHFEDEWFDVCNLCAERYVEGGYCYDTLGVAHVIDGATRVQGELDWNADLDQALNDLFSTACSAWYSVEESRQSVLGTGWRSAELHPYLEQLRASLYAELAGRPKVSDTPPTDGVPRLPTPQEGGIEDTHERS